LTDGSSRIDPPWLVMTACTNYFISQFSFGDLRQQEVLHSAGIFAREVLPAARERVAQAV
jgi:hypothetical protein